MSGSLTVTKKDVLLQCPLWHRNRLRRRKGGSGLPEGSSGRMTGKRGKALKDELHRPKTQPRRAGWTRAASAGPSLPRVWLD